MTHIIKSHRPPLRTHRIGHGPTTDNKCMNDSYKDKDWCALCALAVKHGERSCGVIIQPKALAHSMFEEGLVCHFQQFKHNYKTDHDGALSDASMIVQSFHRGVEVLD